MPKDARGADDSISSLEQTRPEHCSMRSAARRHGFAGALAASLERLDSPSNVPGTGKIVMLGRVLAGPDRGPWNWVGPGVHMRPLLHARAGGARVFLLKAAPGLGLPDHTHSGTELTQVLPGAFAHAGGRFGPGDCDDADDTDEHNPVVEPATPASAWSPWTAT